MCAWRNVEVSPATLAVPRSDVVTTAAKSVFPRAVRDSTIFDTIRLMSPDEDGCPVRTMDDLFRGLVKLGLQELREDHHLSVAEAHPATASCICGS